MKNKIPALFAFSVIAFAFLVAGVNAATLATWDFNATSTVASATSSNANLVASAVTVGTGIDNTAGFGFSANGITAATATNGWDETTLAAAVTGNDYYQVTITPNAGFNFVITSIGFAHLTNDALPGMDFAVRSSEDNFASNLSTGTSTATAATTTISSLKLGVGAAETLTLRIYGFNAATDAEDFTIDNLVISGDLVPSEVISCITKGDSNNRLTVDSLELSVEEGYGEDNKWYPLDTANIDTNVAFSGATSDSKMRSIEVKWGIFDETTGNWIIDDKEKTFSLDDGDDKDVKMQVKLNKKINKFGDALFAYAIVTGTDKDTDADLCEYQSEDIDSQTENALILDNLQYSNTAVQCLEEVLVTADIWNIGDDKLENNYVLVNNKDLGLVNQKIEVGDVSDFDSSELSFAFTVPKGLIEKTHTVTFSLYDEDDEIFEIADSEANFLVPLSIKGNCIIPGTASVSAGLESTSVVAGSEIAVKLSVKNTGDKSSEYVVSADGYSNWASSAKVENGTFSLNAGESKDVSMTLQIKEGVSGEQKFNINVLSAGTTVTTQPVAVTVQSGGFLNSLVGSSGSGNFLWIVGALNVILVLAIIVIAVRFFSK